MSASLFVNLTFSNETVSRFLSNCLFVNGLSGCKYVLLGGAKIQKGYNCGVHDLLSLDIVRKAVMPEPGGPGGPLAPPNILQLS